MECKNFFDLSNLDKILSDFKSTDSPVDWLNKISIFFKKNKFNLNIEYSSCCSIGNNVFIAPDVKLPHCCTIEDNVYIGSGTEIRSCACIRQNTIIGNNCLIGNSCEIKNSILLNKVQVPHFNYVGDSILGNHTHLGAGVILANLRLDQKNIILKYKETKIETGLRKFGAILSDYVEIGCNSVVNPGTIIEKNIKIPSLQSVNGYVF